MAGSALYYAFALLDIDTKTYKMEEIPALDPIVHERATAGTGHANASDASKTSLPQPVRGPLTPEKVSECLAEAGFRSVDIRPLVRGYKEGRPRRPGFKF